MSIWGSSINYISSEGEDEEHKNQQFLVVFKADLGLKGEGGCFECVKIVAMLFMDGPYLISNSFCNSNLIWSCLHNVLGFVFRSK